MSAQTNTSVPSDEKKDTTHLQVPMCTNCDNDRKCGSCIAF